MQCILALQLNTFTYFARYLRGYVAPAEARSPDEITSHIAVTDKY